MEIILMVATQLLFVKQWLVVVEELLLQQQDLQEVLEVEELIQVEVEDQELLVKEMMVGLVEHLLPIKLQVVAEELEELVIQGVYHVVLLEEKVA